MTAAVRIGQIMAPPVLRTGSKTSTNSVALDSTNSLSMKSLVVLARGAVEVWKRAMEPAWLGG